MSGTFVRTIRTITSMNLSYSLVIILNSVHLGPGGTPFQLQEYATSRFLISWLGLPDPSRRA